MYFYRKQPFTNGSYGADMVKVEWDDELEAGAKAWATHLCAVKAFEHDSNFCRKTASYDSVGQNLFSGWGSKYGNETYSANSAVNAW